MYVPMLAAALPRRLTSLAMGSFTAVDVISGRKACCSVRVLRPLSLHLLSHILPRGGTLNWLRSI